MNFIRFEGGTHSATVCSYVFWGYNWMLEDLICRRKGIAYGGRCTRHECTQRQGFLINPSSLWNSSSTFHDLNQIHSRLQNKTKKQITHNKLPKLAGETFKIKQMRTQYNNRK